jgi:hypothetical protein
VNSIGSVGRVSARSGARRLDWVHVRGLAGLGDGPMSPSPRVMNSIRGLVGRGLADE